VPLVRAFSNWKLFGSEFRKFESTPRRTMSGTTSKIAAATLNLQAHVLNRIISAQPDDSASPAITKYPPLLEFRNAWTLSVTRFSTDSIAKTYMGISLRLRQHVSSSLGWIENCQIWRRLSLIDVRSTRCLYSLRDEQATSKLCWVVSIAYRKWLQESDTGRRRILYYGYEVLKSRRSLSKALWKSSADKAP